MEDKRNIIKIDFESEKLNWEAPKLISLDKGKTEGGPGTGTESFTTYPS
jgi:hypothetical protein